jgi:hypothetical protein
MYQGLLLGHPFLFRESTCVVLIPWAINCATGIFQPLLRSLGIRAFLEFESLAARHENWVNYSQVRDRRKVTNFLETESSLT